MRLFAASWATTSALCFFFNFSLGERGMQQYYSLYPDDDDFDEDVAPPATVVLALIQMNGWGST
jgi:hypothetical protein